MRGIRTEWAFYGHVVTVIGSRLSDGRINEDRTQQNKEEGSKKHFCKRIYGCWGMSSELFPGGVVH